MRAQRRLQKPLQELVRLESQDRVTMTEVAKLGNILDGFPSFKDRLQNLRNRAAQQFLDRLA